MFKDFINWIEKKKEINFSDRKIPDFHEREVWVVSVGCNIGFEIDGKEEFLRPVLVFKKFSSNTFLGVPLTSKLKNGTWYYPSHIDNIEGRYCLNQIRLFDKRRLLYRLEQISKSNFLSIKKAFMDLIK
jgi:mRNA interferase MazF